MIVVSVCLPSDALSQFLPSYLGFFYLGCGVSLHSCSSKAPKKDVLFIIWDWNAKVGSQETPGVTGKFGLGIQNEAAKVNRILPRECTGHRKHFTSGGQNIGASASASVLPMNIHS